MENNQEKKIYKYGNNFYSFEEVYEMYKKFVPSRQKQFKDCIAHFILAQIFRKCGIEAYANNIETISMLEMNSLENKLSKIGRFIYSKEYSLKLMKLFGLSGIANKYKMNEFINGDWILDKVVCLTLGSNYPKNECNGFALVNYEELTMEECQAIVENFKRNMWNQEMVFYHSPKRFKKD